MEETSVKSFLDYTEKEVSQKRLIVKKDAKAPDFDQSYKVFENSTISYYLNFLI